MIKFLKVIFILFGLFASAGSACCLVYFWGQKDPKAWLFLLTYAFGIFNIIFGANLKDKKK